MYLTYRSTLSGVVGGGGGGPGDRGAQCSLSISCNKLERFMLPRIFTKV
jgi:hypothetical protein